MALKKGVEVKPAKGKLGILLPGMGAVATTFIAGVQAIRRGIGKPIGSLTQLGHIRIGKRTDDHSPAIKDYVSLATLDDIVFGGWDIFPDNAYQAAVRSGVLDAKHLDPLKDELEAIRPMTAVFEQAYVKNLTGPNVKKGTSKMHLAEQVMDDIRAFKETHSCDRLVAVWCGSTEVYRKPTEVHSSVDKFEAAMRASHDDVAPSQIYAYACLKMGVPYANGAPNLSVDTPALLELARKQGLPVTGKDFKTGQTLMKTILAPGFKARMLGLEGWYSTNILGNRDGEVLDDPESFKSKEVTKLGVIDHILQPQLYPELYGNISGWLGYPMQIKVNFLCRDSILAAPIVLDLALFMDFAHRAGMSGIQEWLSFYWKSPMTPEGLYPEHDLFIQLMKLKNALRYTKGDELITHLGAEYYD